MTHLSAALVRCKQEKRGVDRLDSSRNVTSLFFCYLKVVGTPIRRRAHNSKLISVHKRLSKVIHACETIALHWPALRIIYEDISPK